jgi:hypothetical protein
MQLTYKAVWFIGVVFPLIFYGRFPAYAILHVVIMASYIIGDLIAIPFPYLFSKSDASEDLDVNRVTVWNRMKKYKIDLKKVLIP